MPLITGFLNMTLACLLDIVVALIYLVELAG
jgi:hypothetical protein